MTRKIEKRLAALEEESVRLASVRPLRWDTYVAHNIQQMMEARFQEDDRAIRTLFARLEAIEERLGIRVPVIRRPKP